MVVFYTNITLRLKKKTQKKFLLLFLLTTVINNTTVYSQEISGNNNIEKTLEIENDTLKNNLENEKELLENEILKDANDSIKIDVKNRKAYLYGSAIIKYESTQIQAGYIEIDWNTNIITATGIKDDSTGLTLQKPIFSEGNDEFQADEIRYNFKTKKSYIKQIRTKEGEGYIHGEVVKKNQNDIFFLKKADYTTCDAEKPHYSIRSSRVKIIPGERIISGPAYLRFGKIPTPLFLPFGFFPNNTKQSSGILIPSYGESARLGFFLKDGGYYFGINNKIDLTIRADIYTKGSWGAKSLLRYKKIYKYNGNININYANTVNSEKEFPDYSLKKDFFLRWQHQQDPKANPSLRFSANVNAGSSTFHRNNSYTSTNDYLTNTFQSSINITKDWQGSPFKLSANLRHSQNTNTKMVSLSLPEVSLNMNRIFPFKKLGTEGKENWYDNIGMSYNANAKNEITIADSLLFTNNALSQFRNGIKHTIPISTSMKIFKYFTLNPRINITERWYLSQINKTWDQENKKINTDTINKFTRGLDYTISTGLNTKIYGLLNFKKGKIAAFRHVITPNISFSYTPDFSEEKYGIYKTVQKDTTGNMEKYSIMENGIFGSPGNNRNGNINISVSNILEIKTRSKKDTSNNLKKIKLLENLSVSTGYNLFADSLNLRKISLNARTRILDILDITFSSNYDPYILNKQKNKNLNIYEISTNKRLARFTSANASIGLTLSEKTFKKEEHKETNKEDNERDFYKIPWQLNANYNISYRKLPKDTTQSLNFSGNIKITDKWKLGFHSGYDFDTKKLTYTSIDIYRDLHCWEMLFNWIPLGFHQSYTLTVRVKANVLKDLKLEKKKDWISPEYN